MKKQEKDLAIKKLQEDGRVKNNSNSHLYYYTNGCWETTDKTKARRIIRDILFSYGIKISSDEAEQIRRDISESSSFYASQLDKPSSPYYITCTNGQVNLKTLELSNHSMEAYNRINCNFKYEEEARLVADSAWDYFLKTSYDPNVKNYESNPNYNLLFSVIGYCISNLLGAKKAFILLGPPHSGKSIFLKFISLIIGERNCRYLSLPDITDKYRAGMIENSHLILCHEVGNLLKRLDTAKAIISGDPITVEAKGVQPWTCIPKAKIIMAANGMPVLGEADVGGAFAERLLVIQFKAHEGDNDPELLKKLWEERDVICSLAIKEMPRLIDNGLVFNESITSRKLLREYKDNGNPLKLFLAERFENSKPEDHIGTLALYEEFQEYCRENFLFVFTRNEFRLCLIQMGYNIRKGRIEKSVNPISCVWGLKRKVEV